MQKIYFTFLFIFSTFFSIAQKTILDSLLERANVGLYMPPSLEEFELEWFRKIPHQVAYKDKKHKYEVRIYIDPLDSMMAWYDRGMKENPESERLEPNKLCISMMGLAVLNATNNQTMNYSVNRDERIKKRYNADWVAESYVEVGFKQVGFKYIYITCIHKDDIGDVYINYLFNKEKQLADIHRTMIGAIKFKKDDSE